MAGGTTQATAKCDERHFHTGECWERYEPCGEHHAHTWWCGGGRLNESCPEYRDDLRGQARLILRGINGWNHGDDHLRRLEELAKRLGDDELLEAVRTLKNWR